MVYQEVNKSSYAHKLIRSVSEMAWLDLWANQPQFWIQTSLGQVQKAHEHVHLISGLASCSKVIASAQTIQGNQSWSFIIHISILFTHIHFIYTFCFPPKKSSAKPPHKFFLVHVYVFSRDSEAWHQILLEKNKFQQPKKPTRCKFLSESICIFSPCSVNSKYNVC